MAITTRYSNRCGGVQMYRIPYQLHYTILVYTRIHMERIILLTHVSVLFRYEKAPVRQRIILDAFPRLASGETIVKDPGADPLTGLDFAVRLGDAVVQALSPGDLRPHAQG